VQPPGGGRGGARGSDGGGGEDGEGAAAAVAGGGAADDGGDSDADDDDQLVTPPSLAAVPLADVCVSADPLDGTREFPKGRQSAVQCLFGITVRGVPVAAPLACPSQEPPTWSSAPARAPPPPPTRTFPLRRSVPLSSARACGACQHKKGASQTPRPSHRRAHSHHPPRALACPTARPPPTSTYGGCTPPTLQCTLRTRPTCGLLGTRCTSS